MNNSMTGFGLGKAENEQLRITLEMKTVNHRYLDFNIKLPRKLNQFEEEIKQQIKSKISRGRVEIYVQLDTIEGSDYSVVPNYGVIDQYHQAMLAIAKRYNLDERVRISDLTRYQDSLDIRANDLDQDLAEDVLMTALGDALKSLQAMRQKEGQALTNDILEQLETMEGLIDNVEARAPEIVVSYRNNMTERIKQLLEQTEIDENRLLLEAAVFADKTDITEEIVRLKTHIEQLRIFLGESEAKGRKLDFLIQEMNREVNTIGSKSPDVDISNDVVQLKSTLERIREQVQNIE